MNNVVRYEIWSNILTADRDKRLVRACTTSNQGGFHHNHLTWDFPETNGLTDSWKRYDFSNWGLVTRLDWTETFLLSTIWSPSCFDHENKIGGKWWVTADQLIPSSTTKLTYDATKTGRRLIECTTKRRLDGDKHNQRRNDSDDYAKLQRNEEHDDTKRATRRREEQFSTGLRSSDDSKC